MSRADESACAEGNPKVADIDKLMRYHRAGSKAIRSARSATPPPTLGQFQGHVRRFHCRGRPPAVAGRPARRHARRRRNHRRVSFARAFQPTGRQARMTGGTDHAQISVPSAVEPTPTGTHAHLHNEFSLAQNITSVCAPTPRAMVTVAGSHLEMAYRTFLIASAIAKALSGIRHACQFPTAAAPSVRSTAGSHSARAAQARAMALCTIMGFPQNVVRIIDAEPGHVTKPMP